MPDDVNADDVQEIVDQAMSDAKASIDEIAEDVGAAADDSDVLASQEDPDSGAGRIDLLNDVDLHVMIELGRTEMLVEDVLRLMEGSVVELDKLAGDPVDVYVNHRLVARGEVLVLNDNFCVRISEIVDDLEQQTAAVLDQHQKDQVEAS